jgi:hypothetical protein
MELSLEPGKDATGYWGSHTTIAITKQLHEALEALARPGERMEDVIRRLANQVTVLEVR